MDPAACLALREYLGTKAVTLTSLAQDLGVHPATVRSWRDGTNIPRADHAGRLQARTGGVVRADQWVRP